MDMSDPLTGERISNLVKRPICGANKRNKSGNVAAADFPTRNADQDEEMAAVSDAALVHQHPAIFVRPGSFASPRMELTL